MRTLAITLFLLAGTLVVPASDELPYKTCEMKLDTDLACSTREAMAGMLQTFARDDVYTRQKLLDSNVCIELNKLAVKELRKYDTVTMPIFYGNNMKEIPVSWMKIQSHYKEDFVDVFMVEKFLKCK